MARKKADIAKDINELKEELGLNQVPVDELVDNNNAKELEAMLKKLQEYEVDETSTDSSKGGEKVQDDGDEEKEAEKEASKNPPNPLSQGGTNGKLDLTGIEVKSGKVTFSYSDGSSQDIPWVEENRKFLLDLFRQCNNQAIMAKKPEPNKKQLARIAKRYFAEGARMCIKISHIKAANVRKLFESGTDREDMLKHKAISIDDCAAIVNEFSSRYKVQRYEG